MTPITDRLRIEGPHPITGRMTLLIRSVYGDGRVEYHDLSTKEAAALVAALTPTPARTTTEEQDALTRRVTSGCQPPRSAASTDSDGYAHCRDCRTATWCAKCSLCLAESSPDEQGKAVAALLTRPEGSQAIVSASNRSSSLPAVPGPQEAQLSLHSQIMNIRADVPAEVDDKSYRIGHRDARHAAAELADAVLYADARAEGPPTPHPNQCGSGGVDSCGCAYINGTRLPCAKHQEAVPPAAPGAEDAPKKTHRCMRCNETFRCVHGPNCQAQKDVMPNIVAADGRSTTEHCPAAPDWAWIRAYGDRMRAAGHIEATLVHARAASPAPAAGSANDDTRRLLHALRQKRLVDGLNGRTWDASAHWLWEREIQAVEKRLGEADADPLTERIGRGDMSSAEAAVVLASRKEAPPPSAGVVPSDNTTTI